MEPTQTHEVFEISSDEEEEDVDLVGKEGDWLTDMLENEKEDSDEVVILGEMSSNSTTSVNQKESNISFEKEDLDDDDDCLILDGDPDKPVEVEKNAADNESDELLVVSEKGQIACRDYPHPRHLCARYPFSTNPHEKYCDLCHCYVCDTRAPCIYWGTGASLGDHCHSTEKEEKWKVQRKYFKQGKIAQLPVANLSKSCPQLACSQPLNNGYIPPVMLSKSSTIRACSSYSNLGAPGIISPRYHQQQVHTHITLPLPTELTTGRNRLPLGVSRSTSYVGARVDSSHVKFKRRGGPILSNNRSGHGYDKINNVHISQPHHGTVSLTEKNPHTTIPQTQRSHHRTLPQHGSHHRAVSQPQRSHHTGSSQPLSSHHTLTVSQPHQSHHTTTLQANQSCQTTVSHTQRSHHTTISQPQRSHHTTVSQPQRNQQTTSQSQVNHQTTSQPQVSHQTSSQPQVSHQTTSQPQKSHQIDPIYNGISDTRPTDSFVDINSEQPEHQSASQPITSGNYTGCPSYNMALQPQVHSQPIPQTSEKQTTYLPEYPAPDVTNQNLYNFEMDWVNETVQDLAPSAEISQLPCMQPPSGLPPVTEFNPLCPGATNPDAVDFDFDNWIPYVGHEPNFESLKDTMSSELGFVPSQDGLVDPATMLLFDFESSSAMG